MPRLSGAEIDEFLAQTPGVPARIGTIDPSGAPSVVPVWFLHRDGSILLTPRARSAWWADLRRDPRICVSIDEDPLPYRKVTVRGSVEVLHPVGDDDAWRDTYRELAARYVGREGADRYVDSTIGEPRALLAVRLDDAQVTTWRMPVRGEDPTGIWAGRYYGADPS